MNIKLAQHFLIDKNISKKIVDNLELTDKDNVIEIGPGKGVLTQFIIPYVNSLIAVELDRNLCTELENRFHTYTNLKIINTDFLNWDIPCMENLKFVGNIPYYITSPILEKVIKYKNWLVIVFTIQKEVAERIIATPGTKEYSSLTLFTQFYTNPKIITKIPSTCFYPKPKVSSAVVKFVPNNSLIVDTEFSNKLFKIIHGVFKYRRKTIYNSIMLNFKLFRTKIDKNFLLNLLISCNISPDLRPENITLEKYIELSLKLDKFFHII
jgi:16S rRNA (adenine1518-N6/adenine1519-N6)-dimethyltransferase